MAFTAQHNNDDDDGDFHALREAARTTTPTRTSTSNDQQCEQMETITHQFHHAGLDTPPQVVYQLQQQQQQQQQREFELQQQQQLLRVQQQQFQQQRYRLLQQKQLQMANERALRLQYNNNGSVALPAGVNFQQDGGMDVMLNAPWPPRSVSDPTGKWSVYGRDQRKFAQFPTPTLAATDGAGTDASFAELMQLEPQTYYSAMSVGLPIEQVAAALSATTAGTGGGCVRGSRSGGGNIGNADIDLLAAARYRDTRTLRDIDASTAVGVNNINNSSNNVNSSSIGEGAGDVLRLSRSVSHDSTAANGYRFGGTALFDSQNELNDYGTNAALLTANQTQAADTSLFQPVLDSNSLEPLDDTSLDLLVSSLTQISDSSAVDCAMIDDANDMDSLSAMNSLNAIDSLNDAGDPMLATNGYGFSDYLRRSSESFSDSSSATSDSPRDTRRVHSGDLGVSPFARAMGVVRGSVATVGRAASAATSNTTYSSSSSIVVVKRPKRIRQLCTRVNCGKRARSHGLCIAHGGGRRCAVEGCEKSSQGGNMCIKHGGGKRCSVANCNKAAQTHGLCKAHGGGPRCQVDGCNKSSQGGGFCRSHGGGKRCAAEGCKKGTQRGDFCALHGGSRFCEVSGCRRNDRGGGLCAHHGGGKRCDVPQCARPCRRNGYCSTHLRLLGEESS